MNIFRFLLISVLLWGCQPAAEPLLPNKFHHPELQQIIQYQDQRDGQALLSFLTNQESTVRAAAAQALASVQDPTTRESLIELLQDSSTEVRESAAYALGQLYDTTLQQTLIQQVQKEKEPLVVLQLLEALGKCSTSQPGLSFLSSWQPADPQMEEGVAWGIYRCGLRGLQSPAAIERTLKLLDHKQSKTRLGAAHYLARTRNLPLKDYQSAILQASNDSVPEIRMAMALALGKTGPMSETRLWEMAQHDSDYRVQINAIRSLGGIAGTLGSGQMLSLLSDAHPMVALMAARYLRDFGSALQVDSLISKAAVGDPRVSATAWAAALRYGQDKVGITAQISTAFKEAPDPYHQAHYLRALGEYPQNHDFIQEVLQGDYQVPVTTAAIESLLDINRHEGFDPAWQHNFANSYKYAIETGDLALIGMAAQALRDTALHYKGHFSDLAFIDEALEKLQMPRDVETYVELLQTSNYLRDQSRTPPITTEPNNPINWEHLLSVNKGQQVIVHTDKGDITMEMLVEESPATTSFILQLMSEGFYNGKTFHRVVPNFVAQGGCPRGDGWGSTARMLRSELGPLKYTTGSVGMASAGKDTESCQWFITHSPTPHLDGRYTIFAQIVSGMAIVHELQVGDRIKKITISNP